MINLRLLKARLIIVAAVTLFMLLNQSVHTQNKIKPDTLKASFEMLEVRSTHSAFSSEKPLFSLSIISNTENDLTHKAPVMMDDLFDQVPGLWVSSRKNCALKEKITVQGDRLAGLK